MIYGDNLQHHGIKGQKWGVIRTKALRAMRRAKLKRTKTETKTDKDTNYKTGQYRNKRTRELSPTEKLRAQNDLKELIDNVNVSRKSAREAKKVYRNRDDIDKVKAAIKKLREEADYNYERKRTNKNDVALAKSLSKVGIKTALKSYNLGDYTNLVDDAFKASDKLSRSERRNIIVKALTEVSANKLVGSNKDARKIFEKTVKGAKDAYKEAKESYKGTKADKKTTNKEESKASDTVEKEVKDKNAGVRNNKPTTTSLAIYKKKKRR